MSEYGYGNQPPVIINDRSSEGLADANIRIGNMKTEIAELELKLQVIYQIMIEQGVDPKLFETKIEEALKQRRPNQAQALRKMTKPCPKCGKTVKKSNNSPMLGKCMYCGTDVPFYPSFKNDEDEE